MTNRFKKECDYQDHVKSVFDCVADSKRPPMPWDIAEKTGLHDCMVREALLILKNDGLIWSTRGLRKTKPGWVLTDKGQRWKGRS